MVKLSEIPKSQVIGKHPIELFPFLEEAGVIENLKKTLNGEVLGAIDFPYRIPLSGKSGWTSDKNMPIRDINGEIIGVIGTVHDITERKRTEEALKNSEKILSQLNSDKDRFISILSHDLRSPFNNLLGLSQILVDDFREMGIDDIGEISESINKSAKSTFNLLEDILMWARANAGKIPFNPQKTRFKDIYLNVIEALDSIASGKNITISYSISDHLYVYADTDMLKTVLRNLLSNALKFTDNGGTVTIGAEESPEKVTISLSDTGIGITSENLEKLFNISEVLSTRGTADETGSGLGLMLCKEFVEKHGGEIWVESEPGRGSDFRFSLPKPV
jgi:two-component system, sensor histidine kinase and response regulator